MAAEIQQLLQAPSIIESEEYTLAYLNTTFQSLHQLEHGDVLRHAVDEARRNSEEAHAQLQKSQAAMEEHIATTLAQIREQLASARELSLTRHALADELTSLSAELDSSLSREEQLKPTLLEELESLHRNLKELESVRGYVAVIDHALRLSDTAAAHIRPTLLDMQKQSFSRSSLQEYCKLATFVSAVKSTCSAVETPSQSQSYSDSAQNESQAFYFVSFLIKVRDRTWRDIKGSLSGKFLEAVEKMGWPQPIAYSAVSSHDRALFESAFMDLLKLQDLGDEIHGSDPAWKNDGIYPIQALTIPIALRFKFHFEGKRETNRLDKPEWYFTHILNIMHNHRRFLETDVQGLLSNTSHSHINAFREFALHLLPPLTRKLQQTVPRLLNHPSLLAHTIYQALAFDASVREQGFAFEGTSAVSKPQVSDKRLKSWAGISDEILGKQEWFEAWLEGERKFADDQYNEIISSPDAWQVADDSNGEDLGLDADYRPTNSARRVKALIEQITDRYQPLPRFSARTRFLIVIQIPILESYHSRISSSLDAFESLSSSLMRAVPGAFAGQVGRGVETRRLTSGVEGVGRLMKAALSSYFVATEMERWGEDVFFLELWAEINSRAALRGRAGAQSLPDPTEEASTGTEIEAVSKGTIFQELVSQYRTLAARAEDMIVRHICSEVESASKAYFLRQWDTSDNAPPDDRGISVPTTLAEPISLLSTHLSFLARSLSAPLATALYRRIASAVCAVILQRRILQRGAGRMSLSQAKQAAEECLLWVQACRISLGRVVRRVDGPWDRLLGALKLVTLEPDEFRVVVERIFNTDTEGVEVLQDELEIAELDLGDMIDVVRLREDCWR